eukprot:364056-Chlamydomonas_euryale.AAC.4
MAHWWRSHAAGVAKPRPRHTCALVAQHHNRAQIADLGTFGKLIAQRAHGLLVESLAHGLLAALRGVWVAASTSRQEEAESRTVVLLAGAWSHAAVRSPPGRAPVWCCMGDGPGALDTAWHLDMPWRAGHGFAFDRSKSDWRAHCYWPPRTPARARARRVSRRVARCSWRPSSHRCTSAAACQASRSAASSPACCPLCRSCRCRDGRRGGGGTPLQVRG